MNASITSASDAHALIAALGENKTSEGSQLLAQALQRNGPLFQVAANAVAHQDPGDEYKAAGVKTCDGLTWTTWTPVEEADLLASLSWYVRHKIFWVGAGDYADLSEEIQTSRIEFHHVSNMPEEHTGRRFVLPVVLLSAAACAYRDSGDLPTAARYFHTAETVANQNLKSKFPLEPDHDMLAELRDGIVTQLKLVEAFRPIPKPVGRREGTAR